MKRISGLYHDAIQWYCVATCLVIGFIPHMDWRLQEENRILNCIARMNILSKSRQVGPFSSAENVETVQVQMLSKNTKKSTSWAMTVWIDWTEYVLQM